MNRPFYTLNEHFVSLQGEGMRAGTLNHFVRLSFCNLKCSEEPGPLSIGLFSCDSEFESGRRVTVSQILKQMKEANAACKNVILTGGEPLLQVDKALVDALKNDGYYIAIETNGSKALPEGVEFGPNGIDWVTCSPKIAEHAVKMLHASEVKYVRGYNQGIPQPTCQAPNKLLSPAFDGMNLDKRALQTCIQLIHENPDWRLSVQLHKTWLVR